jgi:hypothetical protein
MLSCLSFSIQALRRLGLTTGTVIKGSRLGCLMFLGLGCLMVSCQSLKESVCASSRLSMWRLWQLLQMADWLDDRLVKLGQ